MGYVINIEINGYDFQFGNMGYPIGGLGAFISFENPKIKDAIDTNDKYFYEALKELLKRGEELDALYVITNFEYYNLQGHGWRALTQQYSFDSLEDFKNKALIVLESDQANPEQINIAQTIIDILSGNYIFPPLPEKSPEEKAKASFEKKRHKLRLKLTIERGYKCEQCEKCDEGSLCIIRKDDSVLDYEINNLVFRCRACLNKMKKKK